MKKVIGLGGVFLRCKDVEHTRTWYSKHLGIAMESWGAMFKSDEESRSDSYSVLSFFRSSSEYFAPSESAVMINFRVHDLNALLEDLKSEGIPLIGDPTEDEFGKFAWIMDPEGNKIELWQQL
ncbi:MAG: VOC family protein [Bacteroidetes bacterium]|nr:VOC family protein [Bacteroidota bacterium]